MLVELTPDQALFRETTERFLSEHAPPDRLRRLRDDPDGFEAGYWRRGAELGWTSLLVGDGQGGGSISGESLVDLSLVAHEFGRRAAPGPLAVTNVVSSTLGLHGAHPEVLAGLLDGTTVATWCPPEPAGEPGSWRTGVEVVRHGSRMLARGRAAPVESAGQAQHLLVTCRQGPGLTQILVPVTARGVSLSPMGTVDLSRRFASVTLDDVEVGPEMVIGDPGTAAPDVERQLRQLLAVTNAEAVGTMQAAFDMTVAWSFDRYTFGRPLASYQALKHRFADMTAWVEAAHAISDAACRAAQEESESADELLSTAKAFIGEYGAEVLQQCVQLHGGIGVTFEHDLHLLLRRFTVDRSFGGTPAEHRQRVAMEAARRREVAA